MPRPTPPSWTRVLALLVLGLASLGSSCRDGLFHFEAPRWGQLSDVGAPLEVVLSLPPMALPETVEVLAETGETLVPESPRLEGDRWIASLSGLDAGRQRIEARVKVGPASMPALQIEVFAITWVDLAAFESPDECEVLNGVECLLPFPSSRFLEAAETETGWRVRYPAVGMPAAPAPLDPDGFDGNDGFSPMVQILTHFPGGVDPELSGASRLLPETRTYGTRSLDPDSPTLLFDVDAGMQPVLHFVERDAPAVEAGNPREVLYLRPGVSLTPGHRYIVALRDLVDPSGSAVRAESAFAALRDGRPTTVPGVEARRSGMLEIFQKLESAGVARGDLLLAFDFVVQSDADLTGAMLAMRERAFARLGLPDDPFLSFQVLPFGAGSEEFDCDAPGAVTWRDVRGTYKVSLFLDDDPLLNPQAPSRLVDDDGDGLPDEQGTLLANFTIRIPCKVLEDGGTPLPPLLTGHGLFGNGPSIVGVADGISETLQEAGLGSFDRVAGATEWLGLSAFDFALTEPSFVLGLLGNLDEFGALPDRLQQGMVNTLVLARMLKDGRFNRHPAFQTPGGVGVFAGPEAELGYVGISLGGIMGLFFSALSPDVGHVAVDIPGSNFSMLVQRSGAIGLISTVLLGVIPDPMDQALVWGLAQELWARGEPAGYLTHVTRDPLPGSGDPKKVLMTVARFDGIVPNESSEITARTLGLPNLRGGVPATGSAVSARPLVPDLAGPLGPGDPDFVGAQVWYDLAMYDLENPEHLPFIPPLANTPPLGDGGPFDVVSACEPHGRSFQTLAEQLQIARWLQDPSEVPPSLAGTPGAISNTCDGVCDGFASGGDPNPDELDGGRLVPCDPLTEPPPNIGF